MNASGTSDRWPFAADQQVAQPQQPARTSASRTPAPQYPVPGQRPQGQQQRPPQQYGAQARAPKPPVPVGRRLIGVAVLLALTALSLPMHVMTIFFIYLQFESPGDPGSAVLLIAGTFLGSFLALLVTGTLAQMAGGFPGRWRARATLAALSGVLSIGIAYLGALTLF